MILRRLATFSLRVAKSSCAHRGRETERHADAIGNQSNTSRSRSISVVPGEFRRGSNQGKEDDQPCLALGPADTSRNVRTANALAWFSLS